MRQTLQSLFGLELSTAQKVIVASVVILVLLALLGLFVRQIQGGRLRLRGQAGGRQRQPRLGVVDTYDLDRQRQLVLIRRDNIEHFVMIGGASDVVVETNIMRSGGRAASPSYVDTAMPDRPLPPFDTLVPPAEPALRTGEDVRKAGAIVEAPDVLPPLPSRPSSAHGDIAAAAAASAGVAAALGFPDSEPPPAPAKPVAPPPPLPMTSVTTGPAPSFAREHAPAPAVSAGELDDMTRQLEEALKRPFSAVRPANLPGEPPQESMAPPVRSPAAALKPAEKPVVEAPKPALEPFQPVAQPPIPEFKPEFRPEPKTEFKPEPAPIPTPTLAPAPRQPMLASDVEAELAAALGLTPERATPTAFAPVPKVPEPKASEAKAPEAKAAEVNTPEPKPAEAKVSEPTKPEPQPADVPEPAVEAKPVSGESGSLIDTDELDEAFAAVEKPAPEAKPKADKPAETESKEIDPFSVDAIEAEFARLLGRDPKAKS